MPELPEIQALAERLNAAFKGSTLTRYEVQGISGLKTVQPSPGDLKGQRLEEVRRRGKYLVFAFERGETVMIHLSQAGRADIESPPKKTKPRGAIMRLVFDDNTALLVREHGTQRKAGWWVLAPGDDGPAATLGPEPDDPAFAELLRTGDSTRHLHSLLRDQHVVAGIGRGYADDMLNRAGLSPFASLASLDTESRERLLHVVRSVLGEALEGERARTGGLSDARLGDRFAVHNRSGQPCPQCGQALQRVSFDSHEVVYCPHCQTKGKVLADRRLSRLLR